MAGATVTAIYTVTTLLLAVAIGLPFQMALLLGLSFALAVHFTLQRRFVWAHGSRFALPLSRQVRRYACVAATQYAVTAIASKLLPPVLGLSTEVVYLLAVVLLTTTNFLVFRHIVFHPEPARAGTR